MLVVLIACILVAIFISNGKRNINDFYKINYDQVNKVDIINGNNGDITTVENKETISQILAYLSSLSIIRTYDKESSGWSYRFSIYENNIEKLNITFLGNDFCKIDGIKYKIEKKTDITIDELYEKAKTAP